MDKFNKYNKYLYIILRLSIMIDIFRRTKENLLHSIIYLGLFILIMVNDHLKWDKFYKNTKYFYTSFLISMILGFYISLIIEGYSNIYLFVILYELILFTAGPISKKFIILQIGSIIGLILINIYRYGDGGIKLLELLQEDFLDIIISLVTFLFYLLVLFMYKSLNREKRKVEELNRELNLSYNKLKEQSEEIEKLTITRERNRLAGEIHDNLGHGLVALNMNLDVAEKIIDKDPNKARELVNKSIGLTKENMENLRRAVYALKEEKSTNFIESIKAISDNMKGTGAVNIDSNIDEEAEELSPEYKEILYSSIKEAITNSVKHGKADEIIIEIKIEDGVNLNIRDNGLGCRELIRGNGLLAMENRVELYKGKVNFKYNNKGFEVNLSLPI